MERQRRRDRGGETEEARQRNRDRGGDIYTEIHRKRHRLTEPHRQT